MSTARRAWRGGRADWKLHLLSAFSLAVAFVCLATALLIVFNLDAVRARWERAGRASVYLRDGMSEASMADLRHALSRTDGVTSVQYISPVDARREIVGDASENLLSALPAEAFPASIEFQIDPAMSEESLQAIATRLRQVPAVESVETYQRYTDKLKGLLHAAMVASILLAIVVLAAVVSVVGSTVGLALQRRSIEIDVLRLVGATEQYVRRPFVIEGCAQGAVGAAAAVALLGLLYLIVRPYVQGAATLMLGITPSFLPWYAVLGLIIMGASLGAGASHLSLRRMATV